jgi:hypothetical protein
MRKPRLIQLEDVLLSPGVDLSGPAFGDQGATFHGIILPDFTARLGRKKIGGSFVLNGSNGSNKTFIFYSHPNYIIATILTL